MKLTKQQEKDAMKVYESYWDNYLKGNVESMANLLDDDYTQIGSAEAEVFFNKKDAVQFLYDTIDQVSGKLEMRNRSTRLEQQDNLILIHELCDIYVLAENKWAFYSKARASTLIQHKKEGWKFVHQHSSFPDARTGEGENIAIDKIAEENRELREAVKRRTVELETKSRELEIETSLERVRSSALAMKKPEDMLDVCRIISDQLQSLGVNEIRNVQTAIFYETKKTYINFEYYTKHNKSIITEVDYRTHELQELFASKMIKGVEELFSETLKSKEVKDWYAYQKTTNQFADSFLETAESLSYYWYSLGSVALGMSTYVPLNEQEINLFKRFRNVFELAYRRFIDIQLAIAQAKEAKIEAALEKVRAAAMSMNKPDDLLSVCEVLYTEFRKLGFDEMRNAMINIHNDEKGTFINYDYSDEIGKSKNHLTYNIHPVIEKQIKQIRSANDAFSETSFTGKDLEEWKKFRKKIGEKDDQRIDNISALYYYFYSIGTGSIGISTFNPIGEEKLTLLKRFRNVFSLSYQRYSDIALAEVQAREAKIEAALERVRAKAMAMHTSNDLSDTMRVIFKELPKLGINSLRCGVVLLSRGSFRGIFYAAATTPESDSFTMIGDGDMTAHPVFENQYRCWLKNENYFTTLSDANLQSYYEALFARVSMPYKPREHKAQTEHGYYFPFSEGMFYAWDEKPYLENEINILNRFKAIIDLTFRRYLDLQKAEAQAREAQIEAALERVRSRTMGMQKSEELKEVIRVVYEQFVHLKIFIEHAGFIMDYKVRGDMQIWLADHHEVPSLVTIPYFDCAHWNSFIEAKTTGKDFFANHLTFEEKNKFYQDLFKLIPGVPEETLEYYFSCPGLAISTILLENVGLYIENFSGVPYTDEDNNTLMRFGKVFQQTYTRFLDLQKVETQVREAKIETSLERVRSKAMAMHSPNDLSETVNVFFKELKTLGIIPIRCGVGQIDEATRTTSLTTTTSSQQGESFQVIGKVKQTGHPVLDGIFDHWKLQKEYHPILEGEDINAYYSVMNAQIGYPEYPEGVTQYGNSFFFKEGFVFAWTENLLSEEELIIFRRFTSVISLTYRRYLDLKEAEERNNIIQADNNRKTKELEDARQLQLSMLPKEIPELPHLDIAVYMKTATEVGGDYYDFNVDTDGTLTVLVGDATGHGMMSGMMVSIMKSFFISNKANIELKQFFETTNNSIKDMQLGRLMMPLMGVQITSAKIIATNAGMPSLIYFRNKSQKAGEFVSHNMPLGAMKGTKYLLKEINYEKGDTLLLMSDGFAELKNENNEQYGYPRIIEEFGSTAQKNSNEIVEHLKNLASEWINGIEPDDDVTFVVIKVKS